MPCGCALRHRVTLQRVTRATTPDGHTDAWTTYASTRAGLEPASPVNSPRDLQATQQTSATHVVTIRYRPGVSVADRVLFGVRPLYIAGIQNPGERNRWLVLACEERAA